MVVRTVAHAGTNILLTFCLLLAFSVVTAAPSSSAAGTFSSLTYNVEGGDLLGYEVRLIPSSEGLKAVVQVAQGDSGNIYLVDAKQDGNTISFDIPISSTARSHFEGTISLKGIDGHILYPSGQVEMVVLKRTTSYWERK